MSKSKTVEAMENFLIRVLEGKCEPQETAILPKILELFFEKEADE